jgi:predicted nucleotidyltransferase
MSIDDWLGPLRGRGLVPGDSLAVFVVGSAARCWDNERSDFDIYVVTASEWATETSSIMRMPLNPPRVRNEMFYDRNRRWEITYWLVSQIEQMLAKVSWGEYERSVFADDFLSYREELALGRLENCLPLLGDDWILKYRERLRATAFRSLVVARSLSAADNAIEDALGQMESGHLESATISARWALGHVIDSLVEARGEYGSQMPKWRPNRFRAVSPAVLPFEKYWELETMRGYDPQDPGRWIREVLTICQDISSKVELSWPGYGRPPE